MRLIPLLTLTPLESMNQLRHLGLLTLALFSISPVSAQASQYESEADSLVEFIEVCDTMCVQEPSPCDNEPERSTLSCRLQRIARGDFDSEHQEEGVTWEETPFGPSWSVAIPQGTVAFHLAQAMASSAFGNYEAAVASLDSALVIDPRDTYTRALLGYAQAQTGNVQGAMWTFRDALAISDGDAEVFYQRALVKEQLGDSWGALTDLRSAIGIDHDDFRFHLRRAALLASSDDYLQALAAADRAVATSNDDCADCFFLAGALRFSTDRPSEPEVGCRYLSRAGELGSERSYDLIREHCGPAR